MIGNDLLYCVLFRETSLSSAAKVPKTAVSTGLSRVHSFTVGLYII